MLCDRCLYVAMPVGDAWERLAHMRNGYVIMKCANARCEGVKLAWRVQLLELRGEAC